MLKSFLFVLFCMLFMSCNSKKLDYIHPIDREYLLELASENSFSSKVFSRKKNQLQRIVTNSGNRIVTLDLEGLRISKFPAGISKLACLNDLLLDSIATLPKKLKDIKEFRYLSIKKSNLTEIPQFIYSLKSLEYLDLSNNKISSINKTLRELPNLKTLIMTHNLLTEFDIASVPSLISLDLSHNSISTIKNYEAYNNCLYYLYLSNNLLSVIPDEIKYLTEVAVFKLNNNKITRVSNEICSLQNLLSLELQSNDQLDTLECFTSMKNVKL